MSLVLYGHGFSSYTQKALIALYENDTPFEFRSLDPDHPQNLNEWMQRWPMCKMPVLVDGDRAFMETSIVIEYLQLEYPGPVRLIPADSLAALDVRFLDRFFDLHVMDAMQVSVDTVLGRYPMKKEEGIKIAVDRLDRAFSWLESHLTGKTWATGNDFTLADCAAAPSLFYADWVQQIPDKYPNVRAYRKRLLARPSFARCVDEARKYRHLFPLGAPSDRD